MTSARHDQIQGSLDQLNQKITALERQLNTKEQILQNTSKHIVASQNESQNLKDQLSLTQGSVDELTMRLKKLEDAVGQNASATDLQASENLSSADVASLQKQVARLELWTGINSSSSKKVSLKNKPLKKIPRDEAGFKKVLSTAFESGKFQQIIDITNEALAQPTKNPAYERLALLWRGEAYFQLQQYKEAALDLSKAVETPLLFPKKNHALLLLGDSYVYLKKEHIAALYYRDCAQQSPTTAEGRAAQERLNAIQQHAQMGPQSAVQTEKLP